MGRLSSPECPVHEIERVRKPEFSACVARVGESIRIRQGGPIVGSHAVRVSLRPQPNLMFQHNLLPGPRRLQHRETHFDGGAAPGTVVLRRTVIDHRGVELVDDF
jgi:hypothetical protein